jgi:malonyl-CoA/methylmalonyl-CoA synthetase
MIHASHLHGTPLLSRLGAHALASPSAIAITSPTHSTTYSQLCSDVLSLALRLLSSASRSRGMIGGSDLRDARVAILCEKGYLFPLSLLATWAAGGTALPVLTSLPMAEQSYMVNNAEVGMIVCDRVNRARADDLAQEVQAGRGRCAVVELDEGLEGVRRDASGEGATERLRKSAEWTRDLKVTDGDRRAMMLYTSGTVSRVKGHD